MESEHGGRYGGQWTIGGGWMADEEVSAKLISVSIAVGKPSTGAVSDADKSCQTSLL